MPPAANKINAGISAEIDVKKQISEKKELIGQELLFALNNKILSKYEIKKPNQKPESEG